MKHTFYLAAPGICLVLWSAPCLRAQTRTYAEALAAQRKADAVALAAQDKEHQTAVETLDRATTERRSDVLFEAMHCRFPDAQHHGLDRIATLERVPQAQLLARLLMDGTLLPYDGGSTGGLGYMMTNLDLQKHMVALAYTLLGKTQSPPARLMDIAERRNLASELSAVK